MFSQGWRQNKGILEHATFQEIIANYPFLGGYWSGERGVMLTKTRDHTLEEEYKDDWILVYRGKDGGKGKPKDNKPREQTDPG